MSEGRALPPRVILCRLCGEEIAYEDGWYHVVSGVEACA